MTTPEEQEALDLHNHAREEVGNKPLLWHVNCAAAAAAYAQTLANADAGLVHSKQPKNDARQGENLASSEGEQGNRLLLATQLWYDEKPNWDGGPFSGNNKAEPYVDGHYTQMIWAETTHVGIASATAASGTIYTVGRYYPAGNWIGKKPAEKVAPPSAPTHPQSGAGMRGVAEEPPEDDGGGQAGGRPAAPNRPGGFGGGQMGGGSGMGRSMPSGMTQPWTPPGTPSRIPLGMPRPIPPPWAVAERVIVHGMPPPSHPDHHLCVAVAARGWLHATFPFPPHPGMMRRSPPPWWRPPPRPPIWTPFGWR
ncbi:positive regulation of epithelial to mesenchymal transition [Oleoguttula sp. CCFEE 5521]